MDLVILKSCDQLYICQWHLLVHSKQTCIQVMAVHVVAVQVMAVQVVAVQVVAVHVMTVYR